MKKNAKKQQMVRWSKKRGATTVEWLIIIVVAVALGIPLAKGIFNHLNTAGDTAGKAIEAVK
jgi:hypothetical protein